MIPIQKADGYAGLLSLGANLSRNTASAGNSTETAIVKEQKLKRAAAEFESILMSTFWKSMKESFAAPEDESTDPAHSTLEDFGMQAMCGALGKAGGLGIGKLIIKQLEPKLQASPAK
jgi:Rod binding domain-containing protein